MWKQVDGNYLIGDKWPTLGEDVSKRRSGRIRANQVVEAALEEQPTDSVVTEEIVQPKVAFNSAPFGRVSLLSSVESFSSATHGFWPVRCGSEIYLVNMTSKGTWWNSIARQPSGRTKQSGTNGAWNPGQASP